MSSGKILDETKINWNRDARNTLSYRMLFDDAPRKVSEPQEEEGPDIEEILRENNAQWEEKLKKARQQAFDAGVQEGFEKGYAEGAGEIEVQASRLLEQLSGAHNEWQQRQQLLDPGVLDLAFELAETILEVPVENPAIRNRMQSELEPVLQRLDDAVKPVLWVSGNDKSFVEAITSENAPKSTLVIRIDKKLNAGEYRLETSRETIVHKFKTLLQELKESLNLPSWKV